MDGYIDLGKIPVAGYLNADPPGEPQFALTAAGSAFANTIQQAGGEVTVDSFGGIGLITPSGSQMGIDTFANVFLSAVSSGTVLIESAGAGQDVNIVNAGTIAFDNFGAGALTGVQTINGAVYPPAGGGGASITQAGALVACLGSGAITISSIGAGNVVEVYNAGTLRFDTMGAGAIENLSTVNGSAYPPNFVIPQDITVSTLTAGVSISTLTVEGVSSINGVAWPLASIGDIANTYVVTDGFSVTLGGNGSAPAIEVTTDNSVYLGDGVATVNISNLSTINGSAYPVFMSTIGDIATGGFVYTTTSNVGLGVSASAITIDSGNAITVGSATANTSIVFASTIQASGDGLNIFELSAGANVRLDTGGRVKFNVGLSTITDGTGLTVGTEGSALAFPLDPTSAINVGAIDNVATINGAEYPILPRQATYYKSAGQNMTSGANDVTFDLSGAWNNPDGYITHTDGTTDFTVVQAGLYQLEFNATIVANGATWGTGSNKTINIDITRSPNGEHAIIANAALTSSANNYSQCVSGTYYLQAGDIINLRVFNTFATAVPEIQHVTNTFDLGTFFTWRFIS
jgi:hypothetical protein